MQILKHRSYEGCISVFLVLQAAKCLDKSALFHFYVYVYRSLLQLLKSYNVQTCLSTDERLPLNE